VRQEGVELEKKKECTKGGRKKEKTPMTRKKGDKDLRGR